jgi:hypothetical protein
MAAVLRVAGGFDRSHTGQVQDVVVRVLRDRVQMLVKADNSPDVDIWGAERRADLFEEYFGQRLEIRWADGQDELSAERTAAETNGAAYHPAPGETAPAEAVPSDQALKSEPAPVPSLAPPSPSRRRKPRE